MSSLHITQYVLGNLIVEADLLRIRRLADFILFFRISFTHLIDC